MRYISDDIIFAMTGRHIEELPSGYRDITVCRGEGCDVCRECHRYLMYARSLAEHNDYVYILDRAGMKGKCNEFWEEKSQVNNV